MKLKSYIFQIALAATGAGVLGACEDMLAPTSEYVIYDEDHLNTASDTATSLVGIIYKLAAIGDRTNVLGEVRGDLVAVTNSANADLRALANFDNVTAENKYNSPREYYAVINNCNYFLAYADTTVYDSRGNQIFAKEMAQVRAIRAWAYLQLALNYGKVPFYTQPLLTEQDGDEVSLDVNDRKDIEAICDYFINELKPYSNTAWPQLHTVSVYMANCYFPVDMVLGDLYLWKASCMGRDAGRAYYREAAKCYFRWIMDTRNVGDGNNKPVYYADTDGTSSWLIVSEDEGTAALARSASYLLRDYNRNTYGNEFFTFIPMDSASFQGYFSEVRGLYNSSAGEEDHSLTPSQHIREISMAQSYYAVDESNAPLQLDLEDYLEEEPLCAGDLRLLGNWYSSVENVTIGGDMGQITRQSVSKLDSRDICVYRQTDVWLRLAEALNNGGFPRMAYAILATGLSSTVVEDSVEVYCNASDLAFIGELNTNSYFNQFRSRNGRATVSGGYNTVGIHSRGSGYSELNPDYAYPMVDSLDEAGNRINGYEGQSRLEWAYQNMAEEQLRVDSMILTENALETCFEGKRYYDLMRFAIRHNDNNWLADPVSKRNGEQDGTLYNKLMDRNNWYLNWNNQIGMY